MRRIVELTEEEIREACIAYVLSRDPDKCALAKVTEVEFAAQGDKTSRIMSERLIARVPIR